MGGSRSRTGSPDPLPPPENAKNIRFPSNTGPDPIKINTATNVQSKHSMLDHHRHADETP